MKTDNIDRILVALRDEMAKRDQHPHLHFDMEDWVRVPDQSEDDLDAMGPYSFMRPQEAGPPTLCKTAACIAGTAAVLLAPQQIFKWVDPEYGDPGRWQVTTPNDGWDTLGAELLGLDYNMAMALFRKSDWPHDLLNEHGLNSTFDELACAIWLLEKIRDEHLGWDRGGDAWTYGDLCYPKGYGAGYELEAEWEDEDEFEDA